MAATEASQTHSLNLSPELKVPKLPPVQGIVFLTIRICKGCRHESNEPNPLIQRVRVENGCDIPCWPWLHGDIPLPDGAQCRICPFAHRVAGYKVTLDQTLSECRNSLELTAEWYGVVKFTIDQLNAGKMKLNMRLRGAAKRDEMINVFNNVRQRCVTVQRSFKMVVSARKRGVPVEDWKKANKDKDPITEGHMVMPIMIMGKGLIDHVVESKGRYDNEVDVDFQQELGITLTETVDDGSLTARAGQQQDRFDSLFTDTIGQSFGRASAAKRVPEPEHVPAQAPHAEEELA